MPLPYRILLILLIFSSTGLFSQSDRFRFINFGAKDGLLDKVVYNAAQDHKGYMWFTTTTGLYRYDGHHFKYFRSPLDKAGSTISNILQAIMCDDSGVLWLGSFTSLQWYDPARNIFWQPDMSKPLNRIVSSSYFYNFSNGKYIWCSTATNYLIRFNKKDSSFMMLGDKYPAGASKTSLTSVEVDEFVYDIHPEGVYKFDLEGRFVKFFVHSKDDITVGSYQQKEKAIYLPTYRSGLLKFDINTGEFSDAHPGNKLLPANFLYSVGWDADGSYFIGASSLLYSNKTQNIIKNLYENKANAEFEPNLSKIVKIVSDREQNLWFCSHNGLSMLPWQNKQINTVPLKDEVTGYTTEPVGVYEEPGTENLLVINSTSRGLQRVNLAANTVQTIPNNVVSDPFKKRIIGMIAAPDNRLYGSDDNHIFQYEPSSQKLIPYQLKDQYGKSIGVVNRNVTDNQGRVFIGTNNNGFYVWQYASGKLMHYNKWDVIKADSSVRDNNMQPCIADDKNNIWFTGSNGVYEYRHADGRYYQHAPAPEDNVPAISESRYIAQDRRGHIWVTTINNGLYEIYREGDREVWKNYNANSGIGLPVDFCVKIVQSPLDSTMWISNTVGLIKFDPINKKVISILNRQHGLYADGHGYTFRILSSNKLIQLYFGALNVIDLNTYQENRFKPVVVFNSIKVLNEECVYKLDSTKPVLNLNNNQNFLQFEFTALLYNNANQNQYAYMLEGADKDWIYSGFVNTVSYSGLKPGTYYFKVKAANNDGLWGDASIVRIQIKQPFYFRWWFLLMSALLIAALIFWWNRYRVNQAKREEMMKAEFQHKIAATEMKALRAQMNPHFVFNSLNSIQKYILQNDHFAASQYLTKFSRLIRLILDHSNQNNILLSSELDLLRLYIEMESLRFDHQFNWKIEVEPGINAETTEIPSMLIQPYVENAIWHGLLHKDQKGNLEIHFKAAGSESLEVVIQDDGIGREKASELRSKQVLKKKSYGIKITEDRIAIINRVHQIQATCRIEDLKNISGEPAGTKVTLNIPAKPIKL